MIIGLIKDLLCYPWVTRFSRLMLAPSNFTVNSMGDIFYLDRVCNLNIRKYIGKMPLAKEVMIFVCSGKPAFSGAL